MNRRPSSWTERVHPQLWWVWGIAVAVCAAGAAMSAQLAVVASCILAVQSTVRDGSARRAFYWSLSFAASLVCLRVAMQLLLGGGGMGNVLLDLPQVSTPFGVRIGGAVTADALSTAVSAGLRVAVVVVAISAAAAICPPSRLLRTLPGALREFALLLTIATTFLPNLAADAKRLAQARRWRGEVAGRWGWLLQQAVPMCEAALMRSLQLGASLQLRQPVVRNSALLRTQRLAAALGLTAGAAAWLYGSVEVAAASTSLASAALLWRQPVHRRVRTNWQVSTESTALALMLFISVPLLLRAPAGSLWSLALVALLALVPMAGSGARRA